ncbi:hypothetical protein GOARA_033_00010, partial [Gordonia araii NBRC 100433]
MLVVSRGGATSGPVHIAVDRDTRVPTRPGVVVHRYAGLDARVMWNSRPPRVRVEHALLDVASAATTEVDAIATLADAVQAQMTTANRLQRTLSNRPW